MKRYETQEPPTIPLVASAAVFAAAVTLLAAGIWVVQAVGAAQGFLEVFVMVWAIVGIILSIVLAVTAAAVFLDKLVGD